VHANDTDTDGGAMTIASASDPINGTVVVTGGSPGAGTGLTYAPDPDYCNTSLGATPDTFTYTLNGGSTATVSVTVSCVPDPAVAVDDSRSVPEDSAATPVDVLANDRDADGDELTIESASDPANGTVVLTGGSPGAHTGLTYQPDPNFCSATPDTFEYTLTGGDTGTVSVTVTCGDDAPTAVADSRTVAEDSGATAIDVLGNDTDTDGGAMTIASASDPAHGTVLLAGGSPGEHTGLTYQPDPNFCSATPDTFEYTLNGGSTATVSVTVTCVDDSPSAVSDSATVVEDAAAGAIDVLANDTDPDGGPMTIASASDPARGTVAVSGAGTGVTYQPDPNFCGPDSFTYTLNGGSTATVSVSVTCVDDPPTAVNDSRTVPEDSAATPMDVLANDTDSDGGPMTIASASDPANGTVVVTGGGTGLTYQPDPNYCNNPPGTTPDTFMYTLTGGSTATVSVSVTCVNDAPTADDETFDGANGAIGNTSLVVNAPGDGAPTLNSPKKSVTGDILAGDNDIDGPGPLTVTPGTFATNDGGSVTIEADGDFTYINDPADNCADTSDFFDYTLEDSGSPELTDTGRVTIAVAGCVWYVNNNDAAGNSGPPPPRLTPSPRPRPLRATATRCSCSTATTRRPGTAATATA
jgi:Bacterial Ig domain/Bacterial cadherin-like domain